MRSNNKIRVIQRTAIITPDKEKHLDLVRPTDHLETDLALDSLDRVSMQEFVDQTFVVQVDADSILSFTTLENLANPKKHASKSFFLTSFPSKQFILNASKNVLCIEEALRRH